MDLLTQSAGMNRFDRIIGLHQIFTQRRTAVSLSAIAEHLDCSTATAKRAIQTLREVFNSPLIYDRDQNGYRYDRDTGDGIRFELPGLWLNESELYALLVSHQLLHDVQPGLLEAQIAPLKSRIEKLIHTGNRDIEEIGNRIRILQIGSRPADLGVFRKIATALITRKRLRILYHSRFGDQTVERDVSPQRLVYYRDNWYLDAWCHMRSALRTFSMDRIHPVLIGEDRAETVDDEVLDQIVKTSYGIFSGIPEHTAILRFSARAAKWIADEQWHPDQKSTVSANGEVELCIPYGDSTELLMDILRYGPEVEVLEPPALRASIQSQLNQALQQYENN